MGLMNKMRESMRIILIILVLAFVGMIVFQWGMNYMGRSGTGGAPTGVIGSIDGIDISYEYFFQQLQQEYIEIRETTGSEPDEMRMRQARDDVWERIVNQTLIDQEIKKNDIYVSDDEIIFIIKNNPNNPPEFLKSIPAFQTDDKFDPQKYQDALNNPNVDWSEIENIIRLTQPSRKIQDIVNSTVRVTSQEVEKQLFLAETKCNAKFILSEPEDFINVRIEISNEEIKEYYNSHKEDFQEDEKCRLKYALFSIETTKQDTQRILQEAQTLKDRIESGEEFAELARQYSQDPTSENGGDLGYFSEGDMIESFEKAAFSAEKGEVAGPVKTDYGFHIIKVFDKKTSGKGRIDSVKASHILLKIEPSLETINDVKYKASDFAEIAKSIGFEKAVEEDNIETFETPFFENTGFIPGIGMLYIVSDFAFSGNVGDISEPIKTENEYYVFKLIEKLPKRTKPLSEVNITIENILKREKSMSLAEQKVTKIHNNILMGKSFEEAAEEDSMEIKETGTFGFFDYISDVGNETKFTGAAFKLNEGEVSKPVRTPKGWYLIKLTEKSLGDTTNINDKKNYIYTSLLDNKRQVHFTAWLENLRDKAKIKDFRDRYF